MKRIIKDSFFALAAFLMLSCNNTGRTDAVEQATEQTEQRVDAQGDNQGGAMKRDEANQVINLVSSNMFEVEAGRLAAERAQNQDVKNYGQMMVKDHTLAGEEMRSRAQGKNIVLPQQMGNDHQEELSNLREKHGTEFDQAYIDVMVSSHEDVISRLEDLQDAEDMDIKSFAEMLPTIRQHHQQAQEIEDRVNTTGTRADRDNRRRTERESRGGYRYRVGEGAADGRTGTTGGAGTGTTGGAGK